MTMTPSSLDEISIPAGTVTPRRSTILAVDDDPAMRKLIRTIIAARHRSIHEAATALDGLRIARSVVPDIVILDIGLPGYFDGFSLFEALAQEEKYARTRTVVVSGYDDDAQQERARRLGVHSYLVKPFKPAQLSAVIAMLENARATQSLKH